MVTVAEMMQANLEANRREQARHVGGKYGRQHELLGFAPAAGVLFFDDGVVLDSTDPNTNQYNAGAWSGISAELEEVSGDELIAVLKFETPIGSFAPDNIISIVNVLTIAIDHGFSSSGTGSKTLRLATSAIGNLVTVPLDVGTAGTGLDVITFNSQPTNIAGGALASPSLNWTWDVVESVTDGRISINAGISRIGYNQGKPGSVGPYFGILLKLNGGMLNNSDVDIPDINTATVTFSIGNTRDTLDGVDRSYVMQSSLFDL